MKLATNLRLVMQPIAIALLLAVLVRGSVRIYSVPSSSMAPLLLPGDQIIATLGVHGPLRRGDVVVFRSPMGVDELMVKRVIGVPGDVIDARNGRVRIGGHTLAEPYVLEAASSGAVSAQVVPSGAYFVMGDNRANSYDSRSWGLVPANFVVGRARMILWTSSSPSAPAQASTLRTGSTATRSQSRRIFQWIR